ncbi:hypothetical protein [Maribacter halichondriae]|uniref:hypothetical protein n=1 Tax=Maribacter halichondriae TaxID=2980554 RepID=UPI002359EB8C|nr:hypothetical protein [Maribacter sp. Hal144]
MEIEELQATWSKLSSELEQQKKLTNKIIVQMTQERYSNKFRTISTIETIGAFICFAAAIYILVNFWKLHTWYLMTCGIFTLAFLLVMPILVLRSIKKIRSLNISNKTIKETLLSYSKEKRNLLRLQQFGVYASLILMFTTAAIFSKIFNNIDFFLIKRGPIVYGAMVLAVTFIFFFSRWGLRSYRNITNSAERILKELDN